MDLRERVVAIVVCLGNRSPILRKTDQRAVVSMATEGLSVHLRREDEDGVERATEQEGQRPGGIPTSRAAERVQHVQGVPSGFRLARVAAEQHDTPFNEDDAPKSS